MAKQLWVSYHTYKTLKECRYHFKLEKIDKHPTGKMEDNRNQIFGFITQRLFERFYVEEWYRQGKEATQKLYNELPIVMREQLAKHPCTWEHRSEIEILEKDCQASIPSFIKVVKQYALIGEKNEAEVSLGYDISKQFRLTGRADFFIHKKTDLFLLDGKGSKYGDKYLDIEQLLYYILIMRQLSMRIPTKVGFWMWRDAEIKWITVTDQQVEDLYTKVKEVLFLIQKGDFVASPSSQACRFCPYMGAECVPYTEWHKKNQDKRSVNKSKLDLPEPDAEGLISDL